MNTCLEWTKALVDPLAIIIGTIIALFWGHKYWRKQKKEEGTYLQRQTHYQAEVSAAKATWALLRYISEADHDDNILRRGEKDNDDNKVYYFRPAQATLFMKELMELFYSHGHGLFISKEVKQLIFELRSQVFGWYHIALKSGEPELKITNREKLQRVWNIRDELNRRLKEQIVIHA